MKPITRKEQFISAKAEGTTPPKPVTREELILAGVDIPPLTRDEYFLEKMSEGGGSAEIIEGTLAEPFSMEKATEIWNGLDVENPSILVVTYVNVMMSVYPLAWVRGGDDTRYLFAGITGRNNAQSLGTISVTYQLDADSEPYAPLEHLSKIEKLLYIVSTEEGHSVQDMTMMLQDSAVTRTYICRF